MSEICLTAPAHCCLRHPAGSCCLVSCIPGGAGREDQTAECVAPAFLSQLPVNLQEGMGECAAMVKVSFSRQSSGRPMSGLMRVPLC